MVNSNIDNISTYKSYIIIVHKKDEKKKWEKENKIRKKYKKN